ncbi:MAG TPA: hypothetical protein VLS93_08865 [Anaeromyxobacteraceae bacterium]|nr:hypothetical protein [Anaeromyxobacteraceae bacterium]
MKKLLLVALPAGLLVLAAVQVLNAFRERGDAYAALEERSRLKRDYAERAALGRGIPADRPAEWRDEVQALSRWYFDELVAVRNRHPRDPVRPSGLEAAQNEGKKKPSEAQVAAVKEFQAYADGRLALLKEGRYAPVASAVEQGLRLDLLAVEPGPAPEGGGPGLRIDFALWGAPRIAERERERDRVVTRNVVPVVFRRIAFQFVDEKGKPWGEMTGPGEPYMKLADPERFSDDFPPGILFGTWWVELFPREAVNVQVEVETAGRGASGMERPLLFKLAVPVPDGWKIPPGATYQGQIRETAPTQ